MELTKLELCGLQTITYSDFYENGRESIVWDFSVYDDCPFKGKTRSGVYGSLAKKGLIVITEKSKMFYIDANGTKCRNPYYSIHDYGTIRITELGYTELDRLELIDEYGRFKQN
jgi:hypothetical protein